MKLPALTFGERIMLAIAAEVITVIVGIHYEWHPFAIIGVAMLAVVAVLVIGGWVSDPDADGPDRCPVAFEFPDERWAASMPVAFEFPDERCQRPCGHFGPHLFHVLRSREPAEVPIDIIDPIPDDTHSGSPIRQGRGHER